MGDIKVLEEIGLKAVSKKTYIEVRYLKMMVDKDFANLNRTNALGFVKIIKREYKIDLSDWVKEFEEYYNESGRNIEEDQIFEDSRPSFWQNKFYIALIIIFVILTSGFLYTFFVKKTENITSIIVKNETNYAYSPIIEKAVENITNSTNESNKIIDEEILDDNASNLNIATENNNINMQDMQEKDIEFQKEQSNSRVATIVPKSKLWVGIIELENLKRKVFSQNEDIEIDLKKEQLIVTGHGLFSVEHTNDVNLNFISDKPKYLHVVNNSIKEISEEDFRKLNKGKIW